MKVKKLLPIENYNVSTYASVKCCINDVLEKVGADTHRAQESPGMVGVRVTVNHTLHLTIIFFICVQVSVSEQYLISKSSS